LPSTTAGPFTVGLDVCGRGTVMLKLTTDRQEALRGLSERAKLLVVLVWTKAGQVAY